MAKNSPPNIISAWPLLSLDIYLVSGRCAGQIEQLEDVWLDFQAA
jgi:hypothetical protein